MLLQMYHDLIGPFFSPFGIIGLMSSLDLVLGPYSYSYVDLLWMGKSIVQILDTELTLSSNLERMSKEKEIETHTAPHWESLHQSW